MKLVFHGEHLVASRLALSEATGKAQKEGKEVVFLEGKKLSLEALKQALESCSLFGGDRIVVVERFFSSKPSKAILDYFAKEDFPNDLFLWEAKELSAAELRSLSSSFQTKLFRIPSVIFKFLDSLKPGNQEVMISYLRDCLETEAGEMVLAMIARQIRLLLLAKDLGEKGLGSLAPWQQRKLLGQARSFELSELQSLYKTLMEIDYFQKTSQRPYNTASSLDLLIASL